MIEHKREPQLPKVPFVEHRHDENKVYMCNPKPLYKGVLLVKKQKTAKDT